MKQDISYTYIDDPGALKEAMAQISGARVIGVDTEGDSLHSYQERVSLIQLSADGHNWIIDPLALKDLSPLGPLLHHPDIVKVFHGTDYDVVVLKRDFGFRIVRLFDTSLAARACGIKKFSLADLLNEYFGLTVDKRYQKVNWSFRPLPEAWLNYAAMDTHYLPRLYEILKEELKKRGRLEMLDEECQLISQREWTGKSFEPDDYLRIKGAGKLPPKDQRVARALATARDWMARKVNLPPFKILSNQDLLLLATAQPKKDEELSALFPRASHSVRRRAGQWLSAIEKGLKDHAPLPSRAPGESRPFSSRQQDLFRRLRAWREAQSQAEGVEPAMVISMQQMRQIVTACPPDPRAWPGTAGELAATRIFRHWQLSRYGPDLIRHLHPDPPPRNPSR